MCDAFLVLAQAEGGLTCYLMPRYRPDGSQNADPLPAPEGQARQQVERLVRGRVPRRLCRARRRRGCGRAHHHRDGEPDAARLRHRLGRPDRASRLSQALNHIRNRSVFQRKLADQPSMRATVADLALELEAQVALVFRLCRASERAHDDPARGGLRAPADAGGEVPGLQEHAAARLRIARVPGRQRLHRGPAAGALLPRIAAQRHLGRLGQRHGARRAARRRPPSRPGDGDASTALAKTAAAAFDVRPLGRDAGPGPAVGRRRTPRALPVRGPGQDRRPRRARRSQVRFRHPLRRHPPARRATSPSSARPTSAARNRR